VQQATAPHQAGVHALFAPRSPSAAPRPSFRKRWASLALGVLLSVALPVLAFQGVNVSDSWNLAVHCDAPLLALGGLFFLVTLWLRSWRWKYLLAAQQDVRLRSCLSATCVGFLANNILPFRLGDLVRVGALRQLESACGARVLGTVAVERVLDILSLVFLLGGYLACAAPGQRQAELLFAGQLALAGGVGLTTMLAIGYWRRAWLQRLLAAPAGWVKPSLGDKVAALAGRFLEGLQVFASPRQVGQVVLLSAGLWGASAVSYYFVGEALGLGVAPGDYVVVVFATAFGAIIPAAPGAVGTFHGFARLGLYLVAVRSGEAALAFAALLHATEWVLMNLTGLYFLSRDGLTLLAAAPNGGNHATPTPTCAEPATAPNAQPV
jgi:glycosyltransferase 2 family protein